MVSSFDLFLQRVVWHPPTPQAWHFWERIENDYNTYTSLHWHHNLPMFLALDGRGVPQCGAAARCGSATSPAISCRSWSPEALEGAHPRRGVQAQQPGEGTPARGI
ncbi:Fibroblast growth factor 10 [Manis javanica]|nr:Fibroblast growth factor 10 [Manis javanica]